MLVVIVVSVVGDFYELLLKCKVGIKDSSNILFGYGGVFDCIDSLMLMLFVVVLFWLFVVYLLK